MVKICTRHHFKPFDRCCGLHLTLTGKGGSFLYSLIQNVFEPLDSDPDRKTSWNIHFAPPVSNLSSGVPADLCPQREDRRWLFSTRSLCLSFCLTEFPSPGSSPLLGPKFSVSFLLQPHFRTLHMVSPGQSFLTGCFSNPSTFCHLFPFDVSFPE